MLLYGNVIIANSSRNIYDFLLRQLILTKTVRFIFAANSLWCTILIRFCFILKNTIQIYILRLWIFFMFHKIFYWILKYLTIVSKVSHTHKKSYRSRNELAIAVRILIWQHSTLFFEFWDAVRQSGWAALMLLSKFWNIMTQNR